MKKFFFISIFFMFCNISFAQPKAGEMILIKGGTAEIGNVEDYPFDETPQHNVTLNSFYIGKYEVTVEEYSKFCNTVGKTPPSDAPNLPATNLTWEDAIMYCNWISKVHDFERCYVITRKNEDGKEDFQVEYKTDANGYRLPTEAEWEFAARGGLDTKYYAYSGSDEANEVAWYVHSGHKLRETGTKKPNELGLYDMSGNCSEWCWDFYYERYYTRETKVNPLGPENGVTRVVRGGSYNGTASNIRVTTRFHYETSYKDRTVGFRLVRNKGD